MNGYNVNYRSYLLAELQLFHFHLHAVIPQICHQKSIQLLLRFLNVYELPNLCLSLWYKKSENVKNMFFKYTLLFVTHVDLLMKQS